MNARNPIFIHYVYDMARARHFYESPLPHAGLNLEVDDIASLQRRITAAGGELLELREANARVPDRVATFRDTEGNGFELRQRVS